MTTVFLLSVVLLAVHAATTALGHGLLLEPSQRGLPTSAGLQNGGGRAAVLLASGGNWTPYEPLRRNFRFTAGLCGDRLGGVQHHKRGGVFYSGGRIVKNYRAGQVVDVTLAVNRSRGGYVSLYMCDLDACGTDDIEEKCFRERRCRMLRPARIRSCQSGRDTQCGPIDRSNPGRFYLGCPSLSAGSWQFYGMNGKMRFKLPEEMTCKRCVLQSYWANADICSPPGLKEYLAGPRRPLAWLRSQCEPGAGRAFTLPVCGGTRSPEEHWGCADVSITARENDDDDDDDEPTTSPTPLIAVRQLRDLISGLPPNIFSRGPGQGFRPAEAQGSVLSQLPEALVPRPLEAMPVSGKGSSFTDALTSLIPDAIGLFLTPPFGATVPGLAEQVIARAPGILDGLFSRDPAVAPVPAPQTSFPVVPGTTFPLVPGTTFTGVPAFPPAPRPVQLPLFPPGRAICVPPFSRCDGFALRAGGRCCFGSRCSPFNGFMLCMPGNLALLAPPSPSPSPAASD